MIIIIIITTIIQSFMITRSCQFIECFYWKLLPEYTTCLGWMAEVILPTSTTENRNQASLKPTARVIIKLCSGSGTLTF